MTGGEKALTVAALAMAAVFARLGFWQLDRLEQRRAVNAGIEARFAPPAVPLDSLHGAPESIRYRRVRLGGSYDFANELVLANRSRRGSPGVHVLTPLRREGTDSAVVAARGWVYAADAAHADLARWRDDSPIGSQGYVQLFDEDRGAGRVRRGNEKERIVRRVSYPEIAVMLPYPIVPYFVVVVAADADYATDINPPPRHEWPMIGEGNHLSYAIQWFSFATIAVVGLVVFLRHRRARARWTTQSDFAP